MNFLINLLITIGLNTTVACAHSERIPQGGNIDTQPIPLSWPASPAPQKLTEEQKKNEIYIQNSYGHSSLKKRLYKKGESISIIGSGIAGLAIARSLINQGVQGSDITVLEERWLPGGKTRGLNLPDSTGKNRHYELGAAVIIPGRYKLLEDLIQHHGLSTRPLDAPVFFDVKNGLVFPEPTDEEKLILKQQAGYYLGLFKQNPAWLSLSSPDGYRNVPEDLEISWNEFLMKHGQSFDRLNQRLAVALGGSGFLMSQNPPFAAQVLRFINPAFLMPILTPGQGSRLFNELDGACLDSNDLIPQVEVHGFQCLWVREANALHNMGVKFKFGTRISQIHRGEKVRLTYLKQVRKTEPANSQIGYSSNHFKKGGEIAFDHAFYTGDLRYLTSSPWERESSAKKKGILSDATSNEKKLYDSIGIYPYKSYMVRLKNFPVGQKESFFALTPQILSGDKNSAVLMMRTYKDTDVFQVWGYGTRDQGSTEEFLNRFEKDMHRMGIQFEKEKDVLVTSDWDYFPHATPDSGKTLKEFFSNAMARQGVGGLWYSSEVLGFGLTIEAYEQGKAFAEWFTQGQL